MPKSAPTPKRVATRWRDFTKIAKMMAERRATLDQQLEALGQRQCSASLQTIEGRDAAIERFRAHRNVGAEWEVSFGRRPGMRPYGDAGQPDPDTLAMLSAGKRAWDDLTKTEKRQANQYGDHLAQGGWAAVAVPHRRGKPPDHRRPLIEDLVREIEKLTGHPIRYGNNPPGGPEFALLLAALDYLLFASVPPSRHQLAAILREIRKPERASRSSRLNITRRRKPA